MKVRLRTTLANPDVSAPAGAVVDLDDKTAKELLKRGYADKVGGKVEQATAEAEGEAADGKSARDKGGKGK